MLPADQSGITVGLELDDQTDVARFEGRYEAFESIDDALNCFAFDLFIGGVPPFGRLQWTNLNGVDSRVLRERLLGKGQRDRLGLLPVLLGVRCGPARRRIG